MDAFTYHNIFDTKGIEYIVIIAFFLLLIPFWIGLNKISWNKETIKNAINALTLKVLRIPQGLFFSRNHTWVFMEQSGSARLGLDDFMQHTTGNVQFNFLKNKNDKINRGDAIVQITQDNKNLTVKSPISGEIVEINQELKTDPELFNNDPYDLGWMYKVKPKYWIEETKSFLLADNAKIWAQNEILRLKDFVMTSVAKVHGKEALVALQEGGELKDHVLTELPDDIWSNFQDEFLKL